MKVLSKTGNDDLATVYAADFGNEKYVEFVESVQPPIPRSKKWVLILSTLFGCPIGCEMCDAGGQYRGKLTKQQILDQLNYLVHTRYPIDPVTVEKFKIQFARMGEPALNNAVLEVLEELPAMFPQAGVLPSISTVAPKGCEGFMEKLLQLKTQYYQNGYFQLQFSLHTTDQQQRTSIIPIKTWNFQQISQFGARFYQSGDRKITLNFALARQYPLEANVLREYFDPNIFLVKITPLNPTYQSTKNSLTSYVDPYSNDQQYPIIQDLQQRGYDVILSIGEVEENEIGSNCGQYIKSHLNSKKKITDQAYLYLQEAIED